MPDYEEMKTTGMPEEKMPGRTLRRFPRIP